MLTFYNHEINKVVLNKKYYNMYISLRKMKD